MLPRTVLIFSLCIPLAVLLGVMLASPLDPTSLLLVAGAMLLLITPILIKHYHAVVIFTWNAYINAFFLPGQPYFWMLSAAIGVFFALLTRTLNRDKMPFFGVPSITIPLIFLAIWVYVTAELTGGIGARALGSEVFGGKRYFYIWGAIMGYFAITACAVPIEKRKFYAGMFFIGSVTAVFSNIAYSLGPSYYFLFLLFPAEWIGQDTTIHDITGTFLRVTGLAPASTAIICFLMVRHGIRGMFDITKSWRMALLLSAFVMGMFSGFRSQVLLMCLILFFQFFTEGLWRTRYMVFFLVVGLLAASILVPFADRMPLSVQRSLTFLPIRLDPVAEKDAQGSLDWRLEMWRVLVPEIPRYFWIGKGYAINPSDLYLAEESIKRGVYTLYESAMIAGDYHSGPLTVLIPFGIFGVLAFLAFLIASFRVLWKNYRYGDPEIQRINTFLLALFTAKIVYYFLIFGSFYSDLAGIIGVVAFSLSLNRGMRKAPQLERATIPARPALPALAESPRWQPA